MNAAWWQNLIGFWGKPGDGAAWGALAFAAFFFALAAARRGASIFEGVRPSKTGERLGATFEMTSALVAAFLSLGYVAYYLRGGPRIVDAAAYMWQARALAHGSFGEHVIDPSASFRGRFMLYDAESGVLSGIFPPGYPLLLSFGVRVGAPMVIGPLLAGSLVLATARLAREWLQHTTIAKDLYVPIVRTAMLAQIACAAARYHTADTMSHGLAALLVTLAFAEALRGKRTKKKAPFAWAGLAVGALAATRLASAPPLFVVVLALAFTTAAPKPRSIAPLLLGLVPGLALLALSQSAVTGSALHTAQSMYYANSDGPPGCFRYGFGAGIGCVHEHGDFVRARLPDGYGIVAALGTTLRRLRAHLTDVQNFEPLALLPLLALRLPAAKTASRWALLLVFAFVLAYVPFYFDGNYPGGGARFYADVLPVEHVLLAAGTLSIAQSLKSVQYKQIAAVVLGLGLVGFAVHASDAHRQLRDRDGGTLLYDSVVVADAHATRGIVYVDTDQGFLLGNVADDRHPRDPKDAIVVVRKQNDAHDRVVFERYGWPQSYEYQRLPQPKLVAFAPPAIGPPGWRFESEAEWPPLSQDDRGYAIPAWASDTCASAGRVLRITPTGAEPTVVRIALPVPYAQTWTIGPRVRGTGGHGKITIAIEGTTASWTFTDNGAACSDLGPIQLALGQHHIPTAPTEGWKDPQKDAVVRITVAGAPIDLDSIVLR